MGLILVEPDEITFYFEIGKELDTQIKIKNLIQDNVYVRISPSGRRRYNIEPVKILLQSLSSETIRITCSALSSKPQAILKETFLIESVLAPSSSVNVIDWFASGNDVHKFRIPVVFSDSKPNKVDSFPTSLSGSNRSNRLSPSSNDSFRFPPPTPEPKSFADDSRQSSFQKTNQNDEEEIANLKNKLEAALERAKDSNQAERETREKWKKEKENNNLLKKEIDVIMQEKQNFNVKQTNDYRKLEEEIVMLNDEKHRTKNELEIMIAKFNEVIIKNESLEANLKLKMENELSKQNSLNLMSIEQEKKNFEDKINELMKNLDESKSQLDSQNSALLLSETQIIQMKKEINLIKDEKDNIQKSHSQTLIENDYLEARIRKLESDLKNVNGNLSRSNSSSSSITSTISSDNSIEEVTHLKKQLEEYIKRHDKIMGTQIELRQKNVALQREIDAFKTKSFASPGVSPPIEDDKMKIKNLEAKVSTLKEELTRKQINMTQKHLESNDMNDKVIETLKSKIEELEIELEEKNKKINDSKQDLEKEIAKYLDGIKRLNDEFDTDRRKAEEKYDEMKSQHDKIMEEKKMIEKQLEMSHRRVDKDNIQQKLFDVERKMVQNEFLIKSFTEEKSKLLKTIESLETNLKNNEIKYTNKIELSKKSYEEKIFAIEAEKRSLSETFENLKSERSSLSEGFVVLEQGKKALTDQIAVLEKDKNELMERISTLEKDKMERVDFLVKEKSNLEELISSLEKDKNDIHERLIDAENDNSVLSKEKSDLEFAISILKDENRSFQVNATEFQVKIDALQSNIDALEKDKKEMDAKMMELDKECDILFDERKEFENKYKRLLSNEDVLISEKTVIEEDFRRIKSELDAVKTNMKNNEQKNIDLVNENLNLKSKINQLNDALDKGDAIFKENEKMIISLQNQVVNLQDRSSKVESEIEKKFQDGMNSLKNEVATQVQDNQKLMNKINDMQFMHKTQVEAFENEISKLKSTPAQFSSFNQRNRDLMDQQSKEINDLKVKLDESETIKSKQTTMITNLRAALMRSQKENSNNTGFSSELKFAQDQVKQLNQKLKELESSNMNGGVNMNALMKELNELKATKSNNESIISKLEAALARNEAIIGQAQLTRQQMIEEQEKKQKEINMELQVLTQSTETLQSQAESLLKEKGVLQSVMGVIEILDTRQMHIRSHMLKLREMTPFTCATCRRRGNGWAWQCQACTDVLHLGCLMYR